GAFTQKEAVHRQDPPGAGGGAEPEPPEEGAEDLVAPHDDRAGVRGPYARRPQRQEVQPGLRHREHGRPPAGRVRDDPHVQGARRGREGRNLAHGEDVAPCGRSRGPASSACPLVRRGSCSTRFAGSRSARRWRRSSTRRAPRPGSSRRSSGRRSPTPSTALRCAAATAAAGAAAATKGRAAARPRTTAAAKGAGKSKRPKSKEKR